MAKQAAAGSEAPRGRGRRGRWTSFVADDPGPQRVARGLHEQSNPAHRLRVEHDGGTLLIHLSEEDGQGWTTIGVDRATRRCAIARRPRQADAARDAYEGLGAATMAGDADAMPRPHLDEDGVSVRPGSEGDAEALHAILSEPAVVRWWGAPPAAEEIAADLRAEAGTALLVIEVGGAVVGGIQYSEEDDPMYRHAGLDIFVTEAAQGRGIGVRAIRALARFLTEERGHHRLTIDPAAGNTRAIRAYQSVGFRAVGLMRQYERAPDGTFHDGLLMDLLAGELAPAGDRPAPVDNGRRATPGDAPPGSNAGQTAAAASRRRSQL